MTEREVSSERVSLLRWVEGVPPKPWADEWFIAQTTFNDRVVLRSLPEEYTYDFKTADDTYIKADKIKRWMQFPDSHFIAPPALRSSVKTETPAAASEVTDIMVQKAWEAYDANGGYSKPERFRAALTAALKGDRH